MVLWMQILVQSLLVTGMMTLRVMTLSVMIFWNDNPVARRVVDIKDCYYILTQRFRCRKADASSSGCGRTLNLYDPDILAQLDPGLVDEFPAFLTHRSGIDKTLMTLIRAGIAHRVSSSAWSKIMRELHVHEHDLRELKYLHAVTANVGDQSRLNSAVKTYTPFSGFDDQSGYGGFSPSKYIKNIYMDYMDHIRPILDQCMSALSGHIIKWDHSFKLPKYMMRLDGIQMFTALFTIVNEWEQIRYQAFVPTKSLAHLHAGLEAIIASLKQHGLPEPALGFTDAVAQDIGTFVACMPSLGENVTPVQLDQFADLPLLSLPDNVSIHTLGSQHEIQIACLNILQQISDDESILHIGFDMEWEFTTGLGGTGPQKTALIQIALPATVYLFQVYHLKCLPSSLKTLLHSAQIVKIGCNIGADFAKLTRDFPDFTLPPKKWNTYPGIIELGKLAKEKNAVSSANASLNAITAATLGRYLSKECRTSEWGLSTLTDDQKHYAALDAHVALQIFDVLKNSEKVGQPLSAATQIGQLVSLYVQRGEVAHGEIVAQPAKYDISVGQDKNTVSIGVSTTKTRALIKITEVLAPSCIIAYHRQSLKDIKGDNDTFMAVVSISALRTRSNGEALDVVSIPEQRNIGAATVLKPTQDLLADIGEVPDNSVSHHALGDSDSDSDEEDMECDSGDVIVQSPAGYSQEQTGHIPSRILADCFHVMDRVHKTISCKHTALHKFAAAFSDTLLVPDKDDRNAVEAVLKKKGETWEKMKSKSSAWLWKRVRCFIPQQDVLYILLKELFESWAPVKCVVTGQKLFNDETHRKAQSILVEVQKGWISDPTFMSVYMKAGVDKDGLNLYHCIRGTNPVEGSVHNPIRRNFAALHASPALADALIADFRHRHNVDCGSAHKDGVQYTGHYDPWLDHELRKLREDIPWNSKPAPQLMMSDTDPLDFGLTSEQFGITSIPSETRINCNFVGADLEMQMLVQPVYAVTKLHLSRLHGERKDTYTFLAKAQGTKFAVTPVHSKGEFDLFAKAILPGGEWCTKNKPQFEKMAYWWSSHADGKAIFYKLPEHLSTYYNKFSERRQTRQTMIESQPQRQRNQIRIQSHNHHAKVLPAIEVHTTSRINVLVTETEHPMDYSHHSMAISNDESIMDIDIDSEPIASSSATLLDDHVPLLATHGTATDVLNSLHPSGSRKKSKKSGTASSISSSSFITGAITRAKRKCRVCISAGCDGSDCPGSGGRSKCQFG